MTMKINCIVYGSTKLERLLSKILPYYMPFLTKRKRVKIRSFWRNRYKNRLMTVLNNALLELYNGQLNQQLAWSSIDETEWEWEVLNPFPSNRGTLEKYHNFKETFVESNKNELN